MLLRRRPLLASQLVPNQRVSGAIKSGNASRLRSVFEDIFCVRVLDRYLIYAPRQHISALLNRPAVQAIYQGINKERSLSADLADLVESLQADGEPVPLPQTGPLVDPLFLGLIPTRGCNLNCQYCDFIAPKNASPRMSLALARQTIDAYIDLIRAAWKSTLEIHFFGGEPFYAWDVVFFAVEYARWQAAQMGFQTHFEVITNGVMSAKRCQWVADHFDMVVLSLDGQVDIHERQRPSLNEQPTFPIILRNAHILADGPVELALRACITRENVGQMVKFAIWAAKELRPSSLCFETLAESPVSQQAGLLPADPLEFVGNFIAARKALEPLGVETILSTDPDGDCQFSFCPVGKDALIVSPDGSVDACYWLAEQWRKNGLQLHLGMIDQTGFELETEKVLQARQTAILHKDACQDCLCQYHCAGGCHVRRAANPQVRQYDQICFQTRLITVSRLLIEMGQGKLADALLQDRAVVDACVYPSSDRLQDMEMFS
jgi:uncharacterized protein